MSKPQNITPLADALSPALSWLRSSSNVETWSPAQSMGVVCAPTYPAREKSACPGFKCSVYAPVYICG